MIEVVFSESAEGSLKIAQGFGKGKYAGGCTSVILLREDGSPASSEETEAKRREVEERQRREWEEARPMGGSSKDVFGFPLGLSFGDISREKFWKKRAAALSRLASWPGAAEVIRETIVSAEKRMQTLLERAKTESVRIWYSDNPDEACGMHWMLACLQGICPEVCLAKLPEAEERGDVLRCMESWGEVAPGEWWKYRECAAPASAMRRKRYVSLWWELEEENAPLRAVLNGKLRSVPENIYDSYIEKEISGRQGEFHQARLIGDVLGKYRLGVSDGFIALQMEKMIAKGELIPVTEAGEGEIRYRRMLRKRDK